MCVQVLTIEKGEFITYFTLITSIFSYFTPKICSCQATTTSTSACIPNFTEIQREFIPEPFNIPHSTDKAESTTMRLAIDRESSGN